MTENPPQQVKLVEEFAEGIEVHLNARIEGNGDLVIEGHDLGERVARFWPKDEYEYWFVVEGSQVGRVTEHLRNAVAGGAEAGSGVLQLLQMAFGEGLFTVSSDFARWLEEHDVSYRFHSYA